VSRPVSVQDDLVTFHPDGRLDWSRTNIGLSFLSAAALSEIGDRYAVSQDPSVGESGFYKVTHATYRPDSSVIILDAFQGTRRVPGRIHIRAAVDQCDMMTFTYSVERPLGMLFTQENILRMRRVNAMGSKPSD
jgi:hypothetical protein